MYMLFFFFVARSSAPKQYDALIIVNAESKPDLEFVEMLIDHLEGKENISLCVLYRDEIGGCHKDDVLACLIEQRCRHVIAVLSNAMIADKNCEKQIKMAVAAKSESFIIIIEDVLIHICYGIPK